MFFVKNQEFRVYNYVNFINIFYNDKELLALNYSKLIIYCGLYIMYITISFNTFEAYYS